MSDGNEIGLEDLPLGILGKKARVGGDKARALQVVLAEAEKETIEQALKETHGNISQAAKILGIHRVTLHDKIKVYSIDSQKQ